LEQKTISQQVAEEPMNKISRRNALKAMGLAAVGIITPTVILADPYNPQLIAGISGQILECDGNGGVRFINGQTGTVILTAKDIPIRRNQ
jgi:hypothetical protein